MPNAKIAELAFYVPEKIVANEDPKKYMDTNDAWTQVKVADLVCLAAFGSGFTWAKVH